MDNQFLASPRQARTRAFLAIGGVALVLAVAAVFTRGGEPGTAKAAPAAPVAQVQTGSSPAPIATTGPPAGVTPVRLVEGARRVGGVAVGFPRTSRGAISAAMEYAIQFGSNLDLDRAVKIGKIVSDPAAKRSAASFAQGPMSTRRHLGLPESGPVPAGASISFGPVAYQLRDVSSHQMTVLLLGYFTTITPQQGMKNYVVVVPTAVVWRGGDWKDVKRPAGAPEYAELRYTPGSAAATAAGWLPLTA